MLPTVYQHWNVACITSTNSTFKEVQLYPKHSTSVSHETRRKKSPRNGTWAGEIDRFIIRLATFLHHKPIQC